MDFQNYRVWYSKFDCIYFFWHITLFLSSPLLISFDTWVCFLWHISLFSLTRPVVPTLTHHLVPTLTHHLVPTLTRHSVPTLTRHLFSFLRLLVFFDKSASFPWLWSVSFDWLDFVDTEKLSIYHPLIPDSFDSRQFPLTPWDLITGPFGPLLLPLPLELFRK